MRKFTLLFLLLCLVISAFAIPARRVPTIHKQSDGTELYVVLMGDESYHYSATIDGVPVVKGSDGDYYYATLSDDGTLISTGTLAHNARERGFDEQQIIAANEFAGMSDAMEQKARNSMKKVVSRAASIAPLGEVNVPVLLVEYSDVKFTFAKEDLSKLLNEENYAGYDNPIAKTEGSAKDYFIDQSGGKFRPNFVVTDIVTLPNTMAYYGANKSSGSDIRPGQMIADALSAADANVDFSIFDNDGDGKAEFVYCIYAGYGEYVSGNDPNTIWPHAWELSSTVGVKTHDGVKFDVYACSNELSISEEFSQYYGAKYLSGIGTMCHEFSHCLGLPDLYDTSDDGAGLSTFHYWDLMDCGSFNAEGYVPVGYSAYERDFMGWRKLIELTEKGNYSMEALTQGGNGYKIVNGANSNEYYVLENRQQESWDSYVFNSGMLISHVDYIKSAWDGNSVNNVKSHLRLSLVPADNEIIAYDGANGSEANASFKGDVWPGTSDNTAFTDTSVPAATVFTGGYLGKPVTNIRMENEIVSFSYMFGVVAVPEVLSATNITDYGFTANWEAVDDASEYTVELEKVVELGEGEGDAVVLLSEDFIGCTSSNVSINNPDDYFTSEGWEVSNVYGESGVLRVGASKSAGVLQTPYLSYNGEVTLSFSMTNYSSSDTGSVLTVSVMNENGIAVQSKNFTATTSWENVEFAFTASGNFCIEFSTSNSTGKKRVNIDNVVLSYKSSTSVTFIERVTTTGTSYIFTGLEKPAVYRYRVQASDGYGSSDFSEYEVVTIAPTSIDDITVDEIGYCEIYSIGGVLIYSGDSSNIPALSTGVYIFKSGSAVKKIVF